MLFSKETLRAFAQSKGLANVEDDALRVLSQDVEYRIKELCQEASKFMLASHRTKLGILDVNYALISRNVEPLFGYDAKETLVFRGLPSSIYYVPDDDIDLEEYLERPLPRVPLKPYIQSHWLAIEGVQPPTQQNLAVIDKQMVKSDTLATYQEQAELKQQYRHLLTKELLMYFDKIIQAIDTNPSVAVECLRNETGIQQLIPYFIYHFKIELHEHIADEGFVCTILEMYQSLLKNQYIFIDPYLHEVMPTLLFCVVGKTTSESVKELASQVVKYVYEFFGQKYRNLPQRVINFLKNTWLDANKCEEEQYGALKCLRMLSGTVVETHILSNISKYEGKHPKVLKLMTSIQSQFRSDEVSK